MATVVVTHSKISTKPTGTDPSIIYGPDWNGNHVVTGLENVPNVDTTNAANITSGTLPAARLPAPTAATLGGVESIAAVAHNWINSISTAGVPSLSQPAASDLSNGVTGTGAVALANSPTFIGTVVAQALSVGGSTISDPAVIRTGVNENLVFYDAGSGFVGVSSNNDANNANVGLAINGNPLSLTGTVTAPTPTVGDNSTKVATTAFVLANATPLANPTGAIGLTANNGTATTAVRSDATHALSQAIAPTWTGKHTFVGPTAGTDDAVFVQNTSYTTNITRFGTPLSVVNAGAASNGLVATMHNDAPANTAQFPVALVGSAVIENNGNTSWGGYLESHQFGTGVGNGLEIDCFNYGGAPSATLPPVRGIGAATLPIGLTLVAAGAAGIGSPTYHNGAIALQIPLQTAGIQWLTGIYMDPGSIATTGVYVDASNTLGPATAARFDIQGTGSDTGLFVGVHGSTGTTNAIQVVYGGTQRFVVNSNGDITVAGGAWTSYSPALTVTSGALTTASATGRWKAIGKTIFISVVITITTNGSGTGILSFALPNTAQGATTLAGRLTTGTGHELSGTISASATTCSVQTYDNLYPGVDGAVMVISGVYEST